ARIVLDTLGTKGGTNAFEPARSPRTAQGAAGILRSVDSRTRLCALLGSPVEHSASPAMHNAAFAAEGMNACYLAFHVAAERLESAVRGLASLGAVGANVTVPHKEGALALSDRASDRARRIGAANVLVFADGSIFADN